MGSKRNICNFSGDLHIHIYGGEDDRRWQDENSKGFISVCFSCWRFSIYKYASLLTEIISRLFEKDISFFSEIVVSIGLSFVIFESISYITEIYRKDAPAGSLLECLTFLSLFSKIVSGPIILWKSFEPQLKERMVKVDKISSGIDRVIIGFTKKTILADSFVHINNTGWYKIRIKANSNLQDEGMEFYTYLIQGEKYFFR